MNSRKRIIVIKAARWAGEPTRGRSNKRKSPEEACCDIALDFLHNLRPQGPWVLTAIIPDGAPHTMTATTKRQVEELIWAFNGVGNIYYSANPTRRALTSKASKHDIAAIEYLFADLDPNAGDTQMTQRPGT